MIQYPWEGKKMGVVTQLLQKTAELGENGENNMKLDAYSVLENVKTPCPSKNSTILSAQLSKYKVANPVLSRVTSENISETS